MSTPDTNPSADPATNPSADPATAWWEVTLSGSCYFDVTLEVAAKDREQALRSARVNAADGEWSFSGPTKLFNEAALRISFEAAEAATARREMCDGGAVEIGDVAYALSAKPKPKPDTPTAAHIAAARKHLGLGEGDFIIVRIHDGQLIACGAGYKYKPIPYPPEDDRDVEGAE